MANGPLELIVNVLSFYLKSISKAILRVSSLVALAPFAIFIGGVWWPYSSNHQKHFYKFQIPLTVVSGLLQMALMIVEPGFKRSNFIPAKYVRVIDALITFSALYISAMPTWIFEFNFRSFICLLGVCFWFFFVEKAINSQTDLNLVNISLCVTISVASGEFKPGTVVGHKVAAIGVIVCVPLAVSILKFYFPSEKVRPPCLSLFTLAENDPEGNLHISLVGPFPKTLHLEEVEEPETTQDNRMTYFKFRARDGTTLPTVYRMVVQQTQANAEEVANPMVAQEVADASRKIPTAEIYSLIKY